MENDTVTISLSHYNELRDFKVNIDKNKVIIYDRFLSFNWYVSTDEAVGLLTTKNQTLQKVVFNLEKKNDKLTEELAKKVSPEIKDISIFQFIKLKLKK